MLTLERAMVDFVKCDTFRSDPVKTHFLHIRDSSTLASDPNIREITWKKRSRAIFAEGEDDNAGWAPSRRKRYIPQQKSESEWMWFRAKRPLQRTNGSNDAPGPHETVSASVTSLPYACMSVTCPTRSWLAPPCYAPRCSTRGQASERFALLLDRLFDEAEQKENTTMAAHESDTGGGTRVLPPTIPLSASELGHGIHSPVPSSGYPGRASLVTASPLHPPTNFSAASHGIFTSVGPGGSYHDSSNLPMPRFDLSSPTTPSHGGSSRRRGCGYCGQPGHYVTSCVYRKEGRPPPELGTPPPLPVTQSRESRTPKSPGGSSVRRSARQPKVADKFVPSGGPTTDSERHAGISLLDTVCRTTLSNAKTCLSTWRADHVTALRLSSDPSARLRCRYLRF